MNANHFYIFLLCISFLSLKSYSQQNSQRSFVKVSGEVTKPVMLTADDLAKMKHTTLSMKGHDNKVHSYTGVAITDILEKAGVTMGSQLRGENLTKYLLVKCADGYQVLFSLAELDSSFTNKKIILAYKSGGKPLPLNTGPFRLVVPEEKKLARSGFQVTELLIRYAKE